MEHDLHCGVSQEDKVSKKLDGWVATEPVCCFAPFSFLSAQMRMLLADAFGVFSSCSPLLDLSRVAFPSVSTINQGVSTSVEVEGVRQPESESDT